MPPNPKFADHKSECMLFETEHFYAYPCLGSIAAGHIMIVPKQDIPSCSRIPQDQRVEFERCFQHALHCVERAFGPSVAIEYGVWGQSVASAHIHIIPRKSDQYNVESFVTSMFKKSGFSLERIKSVQDIRESHYIFVQEDGLRHHVRIFPQKYDATKKYPYLKIRTFLSTEFALPHIATWQINSESMKKKDDEVREFTRQRLIKAAAELAQ